ncbi:MAG: RNA methyltransferase [Chloroflexi bacterium]|nr:RNA methyltransferase [Chloroflexota bacterium]
MASKYDSGHHWTNAGATLDEIRKLQTDRSYRDAHGVFFVEGVRNFVQLADNNFDIVVILYSERLLTAPLARKLVRQLRRAGVPTVGVKPEEFRRISQAERASGVGAIVRQKWTRLHTTSPDAGLCWVILGRVRSPGNFGTLIRTSEAVGGAGFILLDREVDPYAPVTVRATMGALFRQQFVRTNFQSLQHWVRKHHCQVIGASPDGTTDFHDFVYSQTNLLFLGEEREGLTEQERTICDHLVRIPMVGTADSLNLGVAGSLLMYELFRSRNRSDRQVIDRKTLNIT